MAQTIKSLKQQMDKVNINGLSIKDYGKGDYGYNIVYGTLDDSIEVSFRMPYHNDNADVTDKITEILENNISFVRFINNQLLPKDCTLVKYYDGQYINLFNIGIAVDGYTIEFPMCWVYWVKNHIEPIQYSSEQIIDNIKKSVNNYYNNFKILLNTKNFTYNNYSVVTGLDNSNHIALNLKIMGSAFGVEDSFIIKDFEKANIKKLLKQQLKIYKKKSHNKKIKSNNDELIDLRNYPQLVEALKKEDRLNGQYYKNQTSEKQTIRDEFCKTTLIPVAKKVFSEINARFIDWRIGEEYSWQELFTDEFFKDCDYNDIRMLTLMCDGGSTGKYVWANNVITTSGECVKDERKRLLKLGQDVSHNINNTYMIIRDDDLTLDGNNNIIYNQTSNRNEFSKKLTIEYIKDDVNRLTYNIKLFKTNQDKYMVYSMIAIYSSFLLDLEKSRYYKKLVDKIKRTNIKLDKKIENLLVGVK